MFRSKLLAGFECGCLEWQNNRCLASSTDHTPEAKMRAHYEIVKAHGIRTVRDGLPPWLPIEPRLQVAHDAGMQVIWDLDHYWRHQAPTDYAKRVAMAVQRVCSDQPFWCCFNETWLSGLLTPGQSAAEAVGKARAILAVLRANLPDVRLITAEPAHVPSEVEAHAAFADEAEVLGVNFYPQFSEQSVVNTLRRTADRYPGKRIMVSETGLHTGYDDRWARPDIHPRDRSKADWLAHVLDGVERSGVPVEGVCLYPIVNGTDWHAGGHSRYDNGLIREDLSVDPCLSAAILSATGAERAQAA